MNKEFWSRGHAQRLIKLYESHRLLWDKNDKGYTNQQSRKNAYEDICRKLDVNDVNEIKKKIESLLAQYRRERRTFSKPDMAERKAPWWGLESLHFLSERNTSRKSELSHMAEEVEAPLAEVIIKREAESENDEMGQILSATTPSTSRSSTPCASVGICDAPNSSGGDRRGVKRKPENEALGLSLVTTYYDEQQKLSESGQQSRDEHSVYGETVANRLRRITNPMRLCMVRNKIDNIIFAAEMEEYQDYI